MIQMLLAQPLEEADLSALVAVSSGAVPAGRGDQAGVRGPGPERD